MKPPAPPSGRDRSASRRRFCIDLSAASLAWALAPQAAVAAPAQRIVSLNWALSETLYALELQPVAAAELVGYDRTVGTPPTPPGVIDLGFQSEPNLELLSSLSPDLILIQSWQAAQRQVLARFGQVEVFTLYDRRGDPLQRALEAADRIAALAARPESAAGFSAAFSGTFAACRARLAREATPPIYLVQALTATNLVVFGRGSLFDSAMRRLGLVNAWEGAPDLLWGSTRIGVDALAGRADAHIVWIASPDGSAADQLFESPLWRSLPAAAAGRVSHLPLIWGFGGAPTAERFARLVTDALTGAAP